MPHRSLVLHTIDEPVQTPLWQEALVGVEILCLRVSPLFWGYSVPRGDGSAVILIPGLMATDAYLGELRAWLGRIGYRTYGSGIGLNAECPNLLLRERLTATIQKAQRETKRRVHLIGHSLGGLLARAAAAQMPAAVASATTLGSPFRGASAHPSALRAAGRVRAGIHKRHGDAVLPECFTGACTCDFVRSMHAPIPRSVYQTAVYSKIDGVVDWRVCRTGNAAIDVEVPATHFGLAFNPVVYDVIARRLAECHGCGAACKRCA